MKLITPIETAAIIKIFLINFKGTYGDIFFIISNDFINFR